MGARGAAPKSRVLTLVSSLAGALRRTLVLLLNFRRGGEREGEVDFRRLIGMAVWFGCRATDDDATASPLFSLVFFPPLNGQKVMVEDYISASRLLLAEHRAGERVRRRPLSWWEMQVSCGELFVGYEG
jgi:hypothetical protein